MKRLISSQSGFTLVELLVVILILGILVAIAVPNFTSATDSAKNGAARTNIAVAAREASVFAINHNGTLRTTSDTFTTNAATIQGSLSVGALAVVLTSPGSDPDNPCQATFGAATNTITPFSPAACEAP